VRVWPAHRENSQREGLRSDEESAKGGQTPIDVGLVLGYRVGDIVGTDDGVKVGEIVGIHEGVRVGEIVGIYVGVKVGEIVGIDVGVQVGDRLGCVGERVGLPHAPLHGQNRLESV
jgi:hypothetical protein